MNEDREEDLLPIGRFARLCRLSVKQLRHYAELGLLPPAWVDPGTGYRYYRAGQAREALSIGLLRSLDVPLAAIGEVLSGADPHRALGRVRDGLEAELARRRRTLATLERVLGTGLPALPVEVVAEPARRVALAREMAASTEDIGRAVAVCVARLGVPAPDGDGPAGLVGLFPVELEGPLPVAMAALLDPGGPGGGGHRPRPGTELDLLPGGAFARVVHIGPYDQSAPAYHSLLAWCAERGHPVRGPVREVYLSDPAVTVPDRLVTHLMVRLEDLE
ncbi:MerR family transcriptional regulator [Planomonospora parontospora]|uniref:MerR family transcriptional regulator n=1 Tax=Planomonospora parontospora TaxID=58119 RepID=UPI001670BD07|nr:GyrI-like domain-containing protein [Planomonospora parontospora]GGL46568.1 MerR family transcriptional regulator [Planomonospora parontospora subsp. antibiotica]GII19398.1 MerR family transcriptional regulator [Planomonospora parontospora subsp. antibiotica]